MNISCLSLYSIKFCESDEHLCLFTVAFQKKKHPRSNLSGLSVLQEKRYWLRDHLKRIFVAGTYSLLVISNICNNVFFLFNRDLMKWHRHLFL